MPRSPVEILDGTADDAVRGIEGDFALLDAGRLAVCARVWSCAESAVVLGVSRDIEAEVDRDECRRRGVAVLRRASGGGTVVIGPGTVQYALLLPHSVATEFATIDGAKRWCNARVASALSASGVSVAIESDRSGDLRIGARKVGGVALRRRRDATLLHGTLLADADLEAIAAVLEHPAAEPAWRRGRPHLEFLANIGDFDRHTFALALAEAVRAG